MLDGSILKIDILDCQGFSRFNAVLSDEVIFGLVVRGTPYCLATVCADKLSSLFNINALR